MTSLLNCGLFAFSENFHDRASYVLGNENFHFNTPIEVRILSEEMILPYIEEKMELHGKNYHL